MRPSRRVALGILLACTLGLFARRLAAPRPLAAPASPPPAAPLALASARPVEPAPPLPTAPPLSSPDEGADHGILLARRCLALAETDPLAAVEMAIAHNLSAEDPGLLRSLLLQWAKQDFSAAYEWTRGQENGDWREEQIAHLGYLLAQSDPASAARIVTRDIPPGPRQDEAVLSVLHQWALRAPDQARAWADTFAQGPLRSRADAELEGIYSGLEKTITEARNETL